MSTASKEFELKEFVFNCNSSTITYSFSFVNRIEADLQIYFYTDKITKTINTYDNLERGFNIYDKKGEIQYSNFEKITSVVFTITSYSKTINYTSDSTSLKEIQEKSRKTVLDSPVVKRYGNLLEWDSITNADYYEILINDVYVENNYTSNSYRVDTSKYSSLENITVKIRAGNADHDNYFESNFTTIKMPSRSINLAYTKQLVAGLTSNVTISLSCINTTNSNAVFNISYTSERNGSFSFFNPPQGNIFLLTNNISSGMNNFSLTLDAKKISSISPITMNFYYSTSTTAIHDWYFLPVSVIKNYLFQIA